MHLFTEYIEPLTSWLYTHPHWALFITFIISFAESLAIIGSIVPGSVTMTAIGILAGSGVMRIDLTFLAAILGAIAGDGGSYLLGYLFSDRLTTIWPFKNYPNWIIYGQKYFAQHGAASVLIGRFFGPMRSIIPVIAGMMHMNQWHFFLANTLSAIGWAFLYVAPGVLIGTASTELSTESATRLFILILILLAIIWLASMGIRWLIIHTNQFLRSTLHDFWTSLKQHPYLAKYAQYIVPHNETNHYPTAALVILFFVCFFISLFTTGIVLQGSWVANINNPMFLFFQSLHAPQFDTFFATMRLIISPFPLFIFIAAILSFISYYQDWRALKYWLSLVLITIFIIFFLPYAVTIPKPSGVSKYLALPLFPDSDLTLATSVFIFLFFYINRHYRTILMLVLQTLLLVMLFLAGTAIIYLGDNWLTSVIASYFIGLTVALLHWIIYRRNASPQKGAQSAIVVAFLLMAFAAAISYSFFFKKLVRVHRHHFAQYVVTDQVWWNQRQPLLPIYSINRIGQRTGILNLQYVGSIKKLQQVLEAYGWKTQPASFFYSLLMRAGGQNSAKELPLMAPLYQNKKPVLMMTYNPNNKKIAIILRLWRSNYHLYHYHQPIWLGSIDYLQPHRDKILFQQQYQNSAAYMYITPALQGFDMKKIILPKQYIKTLPRPASPVILMIKDPAAKEEILNKQKK